MKIISRILINAGGLLCCLGFCLTSEGSLWWVPCALLLAGMAFILLGIKTVCNHPKVTERREPEYITVTDSDGYEYTLIAPLTDFDLTYLEAERLRRTGNV